MRTADRTQGIIDRLAGAENYDAIKWILQSGVTTNYTESVVDAKIKANCDFQGRAGLTAKVERVAVGKTCQWCQDVAGKYVYPDVPADVWRRHDNCNCIIKYTARNGRVDMLQGQRTIRANGEPGSTNAWDIVTTTNPEEIAARRNFVGAGSTPAEARTRAERLQVMAYQNQRDAYNGIHVVDGKRLIRAEAGRPDAIAERIQTALKEKADGMLIYTDRELTPEQITELQEMLSDELDGVTGFVVRIWGKGINGVQTLLEV